MKKKILLVIVILLLITGCKKNNKPVETKPEVIDNTPKTSEVKHISMFDEMIQYITFTGDVAGTTDNNLSVVITGLKELKATLNADKEINYTISYDEELKGVSIVCHENEGYIYALTQSNHVYYSKVTTTEATKPQKYNIENASETAALYTDLIGEGNFQPVVIVKTSDDKYFTDYSFDNNPNRTLIEISK